MGVTTSCVRRLYKGTRHVLARLIFESVLMVWYCSSVSHTHCWVTVKGCAMRVTG